VALNVAMRNRVTPFGDIEDFPLRGALTGNRGILHRGHEIVRFHQHDSWVTCALRFKERHHADQWAPGHFTWLYFHDEALAFAAGHRPCAECRRQAYKAYQTAWPGDAPSAREMNRQLHAERIIRGTHRRRLHSLENPPDGTFVVLDDAPHVLWEDAAVLWTREGYGASRARSRGRVTSLTPPSSVAVLRAGYPLSAPAFPRS
jgi:hypothetical protein